MIFSQGTYADGTFSRKLIMYHHLLKCFVHIAAMHFAFATFTLEHTYQCLLRRENQFQLFAIQNTFVSKIGSNATANQVKLAFRWVNVDTS